MYSRANPLVDMSKAENIVSKSHMKPGEGKKVEFMASLGLITPQTLAEIHSRRTERKRRSTANPQFSNYSQYEPDRKRHVGSYLSAHPTNEKKRRGRPPKFSDGSRPSSPEDEENSIFHYNGNFKRSHMNDGHDDICAVCKQSGELLMCDTCSLVYHLGCLDPPLSFIPAGIWICPQCQQAGNDGQWPGTLAIVHSYIAHKAAREEEKKKLMKRQSELASERGQLETKAQQLKEKIMHEMKSKGELLDNSKKTQTSIDKLKNFLKIFQVVPS
uniref:PHD finger protein 21A-like n=1 Tax=Saccoglossus kowalevskii TaxID=10224 RepID=A0ABM0GRQ7_SACKO|nr:PREDICTED: PHD finger protein 21A-like [Saccoglossus kowalevskii]